MARNLTRFFCALALMSCSPFGNASPPDDGPACLADKDCKPGQKCSTGQCVPGQSRCGASTDCPSGEVCEENLCVAAPPPCVSNAECPAGELCNDGNCEPDEDACRNHADCPTGIACRDNLCAESMDGPLCRLHSECRGGKICRFLEGHDQGTCQYLLDQPCNRDNECHMYDLEWNLRRGSCDSNLCKLRNLSSCELSTDCADPVRFQCRTINEGRSNEQNLCMQPCRDHSDCRHSQECQIDGLCWARYCGGRNEIPSFYETHFNADGSMGVDNGQLGGTCNADGENDGTCIEVQTGGGTWIGLCLQGGPQGLGEECAIDKIGANTERHDTNRCGGGLVCAFNNDRDRGICVPTCSIPGSHGTVTCPAGTQCFGFGDQYGICITEAQTCDPLSADSCGPHGNCNFSAGLPVGMCWNHSANVVTVGEACDWAGDCPDGSACSLLNPGDRYRCHMHCRKDGSGRPCPNGSTCHGVNDEESPWGYCDLPQ